MRKKLVLIVALLLAGCACNRNSEGYRLGDAFVSSGIADKEPVGISEHFFSDVEKIYCFSEFFDAEKSTEIRHRWIYKGEVVSDVPLEIKGPRWRTWSMKSIPPGSAGEWKVEIVSSGGKVLKEVLFNIGE